MRKRKIIVIDDDPTVGILIAETLGPNGFDVLSVSDPMEGIEKAKETEPDLVFISLIFADFNGLRVSKTLHSEERLKAVPIVMLTSYQGELDTKYTSAIGVVDVLVKPFTPGDVVSATEKILGSSVFSFVAEETVSVAPAGEENKISWPDEKSSFEPARKFVRDEDIPLELKEVPIAKGNDLPAATESREQEESGEDEFYLDSEPKKGDMKKIVVIAASLLVMTILGIGALQIRKYHYADDSKKIPSTAETASPVKGEPVGLNAKKEETGSTLEEMKNTKGEKEKDEFMYSVQLGVFSKAENAVSLTNRMKKKGYDVFIEENGKRSRVLVGRFNDKEKALDLSRIILRKEGIKTIIYRSKEVS